MFKIKVNACTLGDTRSAIRHVTCDELYTATGRHVLDVKKCIDVMCDELQARGVNHDYMKLKHIYDFFHDFSCAQRDKTDFTKMPWYQNHITEERHHIDKHCPDDVNLFDVMEHLADIVTAGMARSGKVYPETLPEGLLEKAYQNTLKMLIEHTEVFDDENN